MDEMRTVTYKFWRLWIGCSRGRRHCPKSRPSISVTSRNAVSISQRTLPGYVRDSLLRHVASDLLGTYLGRYV